MTVAKRGKEGICSTVFQIEGQTYCFSFNGKAGMPLITDIRLAREKEVELKKQIRLGTFLAESPIQNFGRFYEEVFKQQAGKYKSELGQNFDGYYGKHLIAEFGHLKFSQITPSQIERFLLKLAKTNTKYKRPFAPVTIRMIFGRLNRAFNLAKRERVFMGENPCRLVNAEILKNFPNWKPRERWLNQFADDEEERLFNELSPSLSPLCRILLNTGLRPPKEILLMEKDHVNLSDKVKRYKADKVYMIPPQSIFIAHGKDGTTRMVPLNQTACSIFSILVGDETTGRWLFSQDGESPVKSIKKGFSSACERAGLEDLRPYDLRHTFATRLVERNVQTIIISELLGHSQPLQGFGHASRITPGYAHATYSAMRVAVDSLEFEPEVSVFRAMSSRNRAKEGVFESRMERVKVG
jgi:integrase